MVFFLLSSLTFNSISETYYAYLKHIQTKHINAVVTIVVNCHDDYNLPKTT